MVLVRPSLFVSSAAFTLVFVSSALAALRSLVIQSDDSSEMIVWTVLLFVVVTLPSAATYYATWRLSVTASASTRPSQLIQQAYVYCAYAFFAALIGAITFLLGWLNAISDRVALGIYGSVAPLALALFIGSWTPFPALIHRLPTSSTYLAE